MRAAIVESDPIVADLLVRTMKRKGHDAISINHPDRLLDDLPFAPALIVLGLDEITDERLHVIRRAQHEYQGVVIFVTGERLSDSEAIAALKAGANDAIRKPYNPHELILHAEIWLANRTVPASTERFIRVADLDVDLDRYLASKNGVVLKLTKLEMRILYCLAMHQPNLTPIDRLLAFGWETTDGADATLIRAHMSHIRGKLRAAGGAPFEIESRQTLGYLLRVLSWDDTAAPVGASA